MLCNFSYICYFRAFLRGHEKYSSPNALMTLQDFFYHMFVILDFSLSFFNYITNLISPPPGPRISNRSGNSPPAESKPTTSATQATSTPWPSRPTARSAHRAAKTAPRCSGTWTSPSTYTRSPPATKSTPWSSPPTGTGCARRRRHPSLFSIWRRRAKSTSSSPSMRPWARRAANRSAWAWRGARTGRRCLRDIRIIWSGRGLSCREVVNLLLCFVLFFWKEKGRWHLQSKRGGGRGGGTSTLANLPSPQGRWGIPSQRKNKRDSKNKTSLFVHPSIDLSIHLALFPIAQTRRDLQSRSLTQSRSPTRSLSQSLKPETWNLKPETWNFPSARCVQSIIQSSNYLKLLRTGAPAHRVFGSVQ